MKRILCAASALALVLPGIASAQPSGTDQNQPSRHRPGRPSGERPQQQRPPTIQPTRPNRPNQGPNHRPNQRPNHRPPPPVGTLPVRPLPPSHRPGTRPPHFRPMPGPAWHYPRGWHYRRWSRGSVLPHLFLTNAFIWSNWAGMGLYAPPPGLVWVRFGPDLLLVDRRTGQIHDVIYGAFY